jgi:hypothetical protein
MGSPGEVQPPSDGGVVVVGGEESLALIVMPKGGAGRRYAKWSNGHSQESTSQDVETS